MARLDLASAVARANVLVPGLLLAFASLPGLAIPQVCPLHRVSVDANGYEAPGVSQPTGVSPDGRYVLWSSDAPFHPQDLNGKGDAYLEDLLTGSLDLLSVDPSGFAANGMSAAWDITPDGRYVAFSSNATSLAPGVPSEHRAFVRDRVAGTTKLVSVDSNGTPVRSWPRMSLTADARWIAFSTVDRLDPRDVILMSSDVYVRDDVTGAIELVSVSPSGGIGIGESGSIAGAAISEDGRYVVFVSAAANLVAGDNNSSADVFRRDRVLGVTEAVTRTTSGGFANAGSYVVGPSSDGRRVAFMSTASDFVPGDTNSAIDVFVRDMDAGVTTRVNVSSTGIEANNATPYASLSPDGRFVAFSSYATNLVPNDLNGFDDVFLHDRWTGRTEIVSARADGSPTGHRSYDPFVSRDAGTIAYVSFDALVPTDTNLTLDVYARTCPLPAVYCTAKANSLGCLPRISREGVPVEGAPTGFTIRARNLLNRKHGLLAYSLTGSASTPFAGGTLCIQNPIRRTPVQSSGGSSSGSDCTGTMTLDFNAWNFGGSDPSLVAGASVWAQYWSRDPGFAPPNAAGLTDGLSFVIWP
jgi:hypothetical protein